MKLLIRLRHLYYVFLAMGPISGRELQEPRWNSGLRRETVRRRPTGTGKEKPTGLTYRHRELSRTFPMSAW